MSRDIRIVIADQKMGRGDVFGHLGKSGQWGAAKILSVRSSLTAETSLIRQASPGPEFVPVAGAQGRRIPPGCRITPPAATSRGMLAAIHADPGVAVHPPLPV